MKAILDTSALIRSANAADAQHVRVSSYVRELLQAGAGVVIAWQCLYELWVVATRPIAANGLGFSPPEVHELIDAARREFDLLPDPPGLFDRWLDLCTRYAVISRRAHDARLVAWMYGHGVGHVVTLNPSDFAQFDGIVALVPPQAGVTDVTGRSSELR